MRPTPFYRDPPTCSRFTRQSLACSSESPLMRHRVPAGRLEVFVLDSVFYSQLRHFATGRRPPACANAWRWVGPLDLGPCQSCERVAYFVSQSATCLIPISRYDLRITFDGSTSLPGGHDSIGRLTAVPGVEVSDARHLSPHRTFRSC